MVSPTDVLSNPAVSFALRSALGAYVLWMARGFYADPLSYFRRWMPRLKERGWMKPLIRFWAAFCVWGGCFIIATAIATQIFSLHGLGLAIVLVLLSAVAAWLLLPKGGKPDRTEDSETRSHRWQK